MASDWPRTFDQDAQTITNIEMSHLTFKAWNLQRFVRISTFVYALTTRFQVCVNKFGLSNKRKFNPTCTCTSTVYWVSSVNEKAAHFLPILAYGQAHYNTVGQFTVYFQWGGQWYHAINEWLANWSFFWGTIHE